MTEEQLIKDMTACEQTKGMSVLDHGILVNEYYHDLKRHYKEGTPLRFEWKLPDWLTERDFFFFNNVYDDQIMNRYQIYHDCGKPYCLTVDAEGKRHFPDHANKSFEIWSTLFPEEKLVGQLIKSDMDIHLLKADGVEEFAKRPEACSLLITGLSEIHANASMFGGINSISFKIKWKQIEKRGKQILERI